MKILEEAPGSREFDFPFAGLCPERYRLTKGALYPIFAAFRNAVEVRNRNAQWLGGFDTVIQLWDDASVELVNETFNATRDIGHLPDQLGKSRGHWANLHKTLELRLLRQQLSRRR